MGRLLAIPTNIRQDWKALLETKTLAYKGHLLIAAVKSFITLVPGVFVNVCLSILLEPHLEDKSLRVGSWGLYYKNLRFSNLRKMDRFRIKLVSSGLDKLTSLSKQTHYLVHTLQMYNVFIVHTPGLGLYLGLYFKPFQFHNVRITW